MNQSINIEDMIKKGKETVINTYEGAENKKGGRPTKTDEEKANIKISIYFTKEEEEALKTKAKKLGLTSGKFIKMVTMREL